jgi:hypothetical protein
VCVNRSRSVSVLTEAGVCVCVNRRRSVCVLAEGVVPSFIDAKNQ